MAAAVNGRLAADELVSAVELAARIVVLVSGTHRALFESVRHRLDFIERVVLLEGEPEARDEVGYRAIVASAGDGDLDVEVDPEDIVSLVYTSGTTGRAKAAMISQRAMVNRATVMAADMGLHEEEAFIAWAPMFHMFSADYLLIMVPTDGT